MDDPVAEEGYRTLAASMLLAAESTAAAEAEAKAAEPLPTTAAAPERVRRTAPPGVHISVVGTPGRSHHTLLPRTMVIAGLLAALGFPALLAILHRQGHFDIVGHDWFFDEHGRSVATAAATAVVACFGLGWMWWSVAAALNARHRARYAVSAWFAPIAALVIGGCVALAPAAIEAVRDDTDNKTLVALVVVLIVSPIVAFFSTLAAYHRSAGGIGASQRPWMLIIVLPWAAVAVNLLAQFFSTAVGDSFLTVLGLANLAFVGAMVLGLYQAMASFDRACAGRQMTHTDRDLAEFLSNTQSA